MTIFTIPRSRFDWPKFARAVSQFVLSRGGDEAFPIVEDGKVVFLPDHEELTLLDGIELEDIPDDPIERLEAGFDLLAQFAMFQDFGELACANGSMIEVPDLDDEDDERPPLTAAQRRLIEKTECDECRSYGFQISLDGSNHLIFKKVLVSEPDGECHVDDVNEASLLDERMEKFISSFVAKQGKKKSAKKQPHPRTATAKTDKTLMIRYIGADHARRHVIQRGDCQYWTGDGWSMILDKAKVFGDHGEAATTVASLQYRQYKGKPVRVFKVEVGITLAADNVEKISLELLTKYIAAALRLDVENSVYGDGPVEGSFVQARMKLSSLEETPSAKKTF